MTYLFQCGRLSNEKQRFSCGLKDDVFNIIQSIPHHSALQALD